VGLRKPGIERSRDRVLTDRELRSFWSATEDLGFPFGPTFQLMALTGQRRGEIAGMRWSQINMDQSVWTIPASVAKNGRAHEVPLSTLAQDIIGALPRFAGADFVFTTTGVSPVSGFGRAKDRLDFTMESAEWRLHDLRRTVASGMARLGIAPHVIEKVLNHVSGEISGVAAVYNRHGYQAEKAEALEAWAKEIQTIVGAGFSQRGAPRELVSFRSRSLGRSFHPRRDAGIIQDA
jgi:integrase